MCEQEREWIDRMDDRVCNERRCDTSTTHIRCAICVQRVILLYSLISIVQTLFRTGNTAHTRLVRLILRHRDAQSQLSSTGYLHKRSNIVRRRRRIRCRYCVRIVDTCTSSESFCSHLYHLSQVYISDPRQRTYHGLPTNVRQIGSVQSISNNVMHFIVDKHEETAIIDTIMFCTGYRYSYPFMRNIELDVANKHVRPLYQHMVHIDYPNSLFFIGINFTVVPFPYFDTQCKYAIALMTGVVDAPSRTEMIDWAANDMT